jgi:YebC/PmpR family DNA-binding regulatory protein
MAGHSKWANIKHRKAAQDAKRGKLWTKLIREITVAARLGGGDPDDNPRLRAAVDKGLGANMPRDTIDRAISRGAGGQDGSDVEELIYEGYGSGGVAVLVEVMTDNRNRTVAEVRHAFSKFGGNLGTDGSVAYLFNKLGVISFAPGADEEKIMDVVLEAGAEDIESDEDGSVQVTTPWELMSQVVAALKAESLAPDHSEISMVPSTYTPCDEDLAANILKLLDALEELDDVQNVYSNAELPESALEPG